jgi:putative peptidoglycan lipid II flippase
MFAAIGVEGLALGHAISYLFGTAVQAFVLARRVGGLDRKRVTDSIVRITAAGALMGAAVWGTSEAIEEMITPIGLTQQLIVLVVPVAIGGAAYLGLAYLLRVPEFGGVRNLVRGRGNV